MYVLIAICIGLLSVLPAYEMGENFLFTPLPPETAWGTAQGLATLMASAQGVIRCKSLCCAVQRAMHLV